MFFKYFTLRVIDLKNAVMLVLHFEPGPATILDEMNAVVPVFFS